MKAPDTPIAVTLYNLRDFCQTESDLDRTLDKVCDIGYQAVQVSGTPLPAEVVKRQLDRHNLFCCAAHEGALIMADDLKPLIDRMKTLECDFVALGAPAEEYRTSAEGMARLIELFNQKGAELLEHGIRLGYHNHHFEFMRVPGTRKNYLDTFYDETDPKCVFAEIDVHWVTRGGSCPVRWINKVAGRMPVVHFKDFTIINNDTPVYCEVGEGNLDWPSIIDACRQTGVRWYSIEQDSPFGDRDIFDSIKISYTNLLSFLEKRK